METLIIKPKDKDELRFFVELAHRLGINMTTVKNDADELLFQEMGKKKKKHPVLNGSPCMKQFKKY